MSDKDKQKPQKQIKGNQKSSVTERPAEIELSSRKKRLFTIGIICLPVLLIVVLELLLVIFRYDGNLKLFISAPKEISQYKMINRNVGRRYFYMQSTLPTPQKDLFLKKKPENGYRIFVLGGSTTAGFPYGNNIMFSRILNFRLSDAFPDKTIEVVNLAMTAINSYTLLDFISEILANEPDALLIYAGHNEFYGALGVSSMESFGRNRGVVKAYLRLERLRIFLLVRNCAGQVRRWLGKTLKAESLANPTATLMERIVVDQAIPFGTPLYESGKQQFTENLREILQRAKAAGIPVITSELICNIRDQQPFESVQVAGLPTAASVFQFARKLDKRHQYEEAKEAYYRAKDLDALRFRAAEEFNQIIHKVSAEFGVLVVPLKSIFENASPHRLIGDNLIIDHLHPNINGYFLMADAFFNTMREAKLIADEWNPGLIKPSQFYLENWGMTRLDTLVAEINIRYLKGSWPFQPRALPNRSLDGYRPTNKLESLVYQILVNEKVSLEIGHYELAQYYQQQRDYEAALREYKALNFIVPQEASFYHYSAEILLKMNRFDEALTVLLKSLRYQDTFFANKWCGQIYLKNGENYLAVEYLEKARRMQERDPQLLFNLVRAYLEIQNQEEARRYFDRLKKLAPDSDYTKYLNPVFGTESG
jgi:tetratricopeptide (TPR) repeat protein